MFTGYALGTSLPCTWREVGLRKASVLLGLNDSNGAVGL